MDVDLEGQQVDPRKPVFIQFARVDLRGEDAKGELPALPPGRFCVAVACGFRHTVRAAASGCSGAFWMRSGGLQGVGKVGTE